MCWSVKVFGCSRDCCMTNWQYYWNFSVKPISHDHQHTRRRKLPSIPTPTNWSLTVELMKSYSISLLLYAVDAMSLSRFRRQILKYPHNGELHCICWALFRKFCSYDRSILDYMNTVNIWISWWQKLKGKRNDLDWLLCDMYFTNLLSIFSWKFNNFYCNLM